MEKDFLHEDPSNWKWGVIYFNKSDHRLSVPKRIAIMGWTFNFAHPISFVVLFAIIAIVLIFIVLQK